jgi:hypothetical protein
MCRGLWLSDGCSSWWTLVIPYRIETRSDGRVWEKRRGVRAMDEADELTDEEEGGVWT